MGDDIYIPPKPKPKPKPKPEYKYALWYFKYTNTYEKRFNGTVGDLLNRGLTTQLLWKRMKVVELRKVEI